MSRTTLDGRGATGEKLLNRELAEVDLEVHRAISAQLDRQESTLEMIASENFAPLAVMQEQGSVLTNKYAEGYPGRRSSGARGTPRRTCWSAPTPGPP